MFWKKNRDLNFLQYRPALVRSDWSYSKASLERTYGQLTGALTGIWALQSMSGVVLVTQHVYRLLRVYKYSTVEDELLQTSVWSGSCAVWLCAKRENVSGRWRSYRSMLLFINPNWTRICHRNNDVGWHLKYCPSARLTKQTHPDTRSRPRTSLRPPALQSCSTLSREIQQHATHR